MIRSDDRMAWACMENIDDDDNDSNTIERRTNNILERKNQRSLLLVHPRLKTTLVESLAEGTNAAARAAPCYETGATLLLLDDD